VYGCLCCFGIVHFTDVSILHRGSGVRQAIRRSDRTIATAAGRFEEVRRCLKRFPGISDPGADHILLFARAAPVAAVPSSCPHVLVRIVHGLERENYAIAYRESREVLEAGTPREFDARQRGYLLLKAHGQQICKRKPLCDQCPVRPDCRYAAGVDRGSQRRS
jgi:endonuclease III related protein